MRHANLEIADRALDALSARTAAKERSEEEEIAAEAERLLAQREEVKGPSTSDWKIAARAPRKRKVRSWVLTYLKELRKFFVFFFSFYTCMIFRALFP